MMEKKKQSVIDEKRIEYIDIARGISIILMIVGHLELGYNIGTRIIYAFHMPLFIIISGMFFNEKENMKVAIKKISKKLLFPYVVTIVITSLIYHLLYKRELVILDLIKQILLSYSNCKTFWIDTPTVDVLWFIPFWAATKIVFHIINRMCRNDNQKGIICSLTTIIGVVLAKNAIYLPWSFDIVLATMIFYYIGYIIKKYNYLEKILDNKILLF